MEPSGVTLFRRTTSLAAALVLAAACQSPAATSSPPPAATTAPTSAQPSTAPATTAPSVGLPGLFHVVGSAPVITRSMFAGRNATLPGAVMVDADGTYHAWIIAFAQQPGTQEIHYVTSSDAVTWTEAADASLAALSEGMGNPGAIPTSVLETDDRWVMYFVATLATEDRGWDIWRATAPAANGPWTRSDGPVFERGQAGAWDAGALDFPTIIPTDTGYAMFYSAIPTLVSMEGSVGLATSEDGIEWTRHDDPATTDALLAESDPVIAPGLCGGFDDRAIQQPRVVAGADGLYLVYAGYAGDQQARPGVGLATSTDGGLTWGCQWPANALDPTGIPGGDGVHTLTALSRNDRLSILVEWLSDGGTDVWLAHLGPREP